MIVKKRKKFLSNNYILLIISFLLVLMGSITLFFSDKISAQEKSLQLSTTESTVQVDSVTDFSIGLNTRQENVLTLHYPKSFQLEEKKFEQENVDNVQNIKVDSKKHQLSFRLTSKNVKEILFSGRFLEKGEQKITVQAGEEKEQLTITVQGSSKEGTADKTENSDLEQVTSTKESVTDSLSDALVEKAQPRVDTVPSFDWDLLNKDGLDLSTFEQVSVNTPVKLTGGVFDKQQREYYMFFGHTGKGNSYTYDTGSFNKAGNMLAPLGEKSNLPLLGPMMIGVKKQSGTEKSSHVFGYDYSYDNTNVGTSAANFDIGEINPTDGSIIKSGVMEGNAAPRTWIISQYVKKNEIISYGFIAKKKITGSSEIFYQPVRVHGYIVSEGTGRIRYDVSFYNGDQEIKDYALVYGAHMDVGGNHTSSKLFSYDKAGMYFNEPDKTLADGLPARIYFYTNVGYDNFSGPTDYKVGNLSAYSITEYKIGYWARIYDEKWIYPIDGYKNPYEAWDPIEPSGYQFPLSHPVFALRWNKMNVKPDEVGTGSLDLSIEEPAPVLPVAQKSYENETTKGKENHVGDTLSFSVIANNRGDMDVWEQVKMTDVLPKELELDTSSITLVDTNGKESLLDPSIYDSEKHEFNAGLYNIPPKEQIEIKYKAKIISGLDQTIINKFIATNQKFETADAEAKIPISEKIDIKLKEEVFHEDGSVADKAIPGEKLFYKTTILNPKATKKLNYKNLQGWIPFDSELENMTNATLKDQTGNIIGIVYRSTENGNILYVSTVAPGAEGPAVNQNFYIEYQATVKEGTPDGTLIKSQATFVGEFSDGSRIDEEQRIFSNEVQTEIHEKRGDLVFVSAPKVLDFGEELKISAKNKTYPIVSKDEALVVEDHRGTGEHWSMTATLLKELSSTSGHELTNSLHYKKQKQDYTFTVGNAIPVVEKETLDEQGVDISAEWAGTEDGPFLDVKAGQPRAEKYSGAIKWTLEDVPANNQE